MEFRLYHESSVSSKEQSSTKNYKILSVIVILLSILCVFLLPSWFCFSISTVAISVSTYYLKTHLKHKRPIYLTVSKNEISYFCEEKNEFVTILTSDISGINTDFCKLNISTTDNSIHRISLMNIKNPQTRWEIKELARRFAPKSHCRASA